MINQDTDTMNQPELEYVGFWLRVGASLIDTVLVLMLIVPLSMMMFGFGHFSDGVVPSGFSDFLISDLLPAAAIIAFWVARGATPGKMAISARIVDANTGAALTLGQSLLRYLGYFVSTIPLCLGLIWVAFDPRKQGWHDKIASTVVVRNKHRGPAAVAFSSSPNSQGKPR